MAQLQQEAESMNHTTASRRFDHLFSFGRPATLVMVIAALSSCHAAPEPESQNSVAFDASNALPVIGLGGEVQTPLTGSTLPADIEERMNNGLSLDFYEKSRINRARSEASKEKGSVVDPALADARRAADALLEEGLPAASPGRPIETSAGKPARPPVMWVPVQPPASDTPAAYAGPDSSDTNDPVAPADPPLGPGNNVLNPPAQNAAELTPPVLRVSDLITPLKSQLAMQAADSNSPLREYLVAASLLMLDNQRRTDPATLHDLTDREREVLGAYQDYFTHVGEALREGGGVDAIVMETKEIAKSLASEGQLRVPEFRLCSRITNFGLFDEIATYKFPAMRPTPLLTYVEIEGFKSVPGGDGKYITRVRHELELFSESDGELVYSWPAAPAEDICGKVRRDFFLPRQIQLPSNLTVGRYRLKVRVVDEQSQQQAESVVAFSIIAGGDVAAK